MVEIPDDLLCVFSAEVEEARDSYIIEVPKREITDGSVQPDNGYSVALWSGRRPSNEKSSSVEERNRGRRRKQIDGGDTTGPPVTVGDQRTVDIDDIGEKGDGIARVERGYVVIVPATEQGERVTIEITDVTENVGFSEVISREEYYE